jgi:hypothetical protein
VIEIANRGLKHVNEEYIKNVAEILQETSLRFNRQIIMVTHNQYLSLIGDCSFKVNMHNGESVVTGVSNLTLHFERYKIILYHYPISIVFWLISRKCENLFIVTALVLLFASSVYCSE